MPGSRYRTAPAPTLARFFPPLAWLRDYSGVACASDVFAGLLTTLVSVPQGIAFALLAGLSPEQGLFACILPPLAYVLLGTSRTLLVGPVSVTAVMLAGALSDPSVGTHGTYLGNALVLGLESGCILVALAFLRLGALVNFISHPVLTGFTSGAALLIILKVLPSLLGLHAPQCAFDAAVFGCIQDYLGQSNQATAIIGVLSVIVMGLWSGPLPRILHWLRLNTLITLALSKAGPLVVVTLGCIAVLRFRLGSEFNVTTVGAVPAELPTITTDFLKSETWILLLPSAFYVGLISYVSTVAMAKVTANLRREKIDPNQEALALGASNVLAAFSGSMAVAGGMSQTMLKVSAGAHTQIATLVTSVLVGSTILLLNPLFALIPMATLSAIILVAIVPLIGVSHIAHTWRYQRSEGIAAIVTLIGVVGIGMQEGLVVGIAVTLLGYLWRTSHPHIAVVGRVPHTEHFRNVCRHQVETWPTILLIRVDESLSFANVGFIEDYITGEVARYPDVRHLVLICTAISHIDITALESLETLTITLRTAGITLHLAEVKGPVMDDLKRTEFLTTLLPGQVFFRTEEAVKHLTDDPGLNLRGAAPEDADLLNRHHTVMRLP